MRVHTRRRFLVSVSSVVLAACTTAVQTAKESSRPDSPYAANPGLGIWPDIVAKAPADVRAAYTYATSAQQSLQYIPCYCGCGSSGHNDNLGCYVQRFTTGGWMVLEPHATGCGVCVGITLDVVAWEKQGIGIKEIRRMIDAKWSKAGPGTPTRKP